MPINSGWRDAIDQIIYPEDYCKWEDLGDGANDYHTITNVNSATVNSSGVTFENGGTSYIKIDYTNSLKLHGRGSFTIEFAIKINTDSTSTTNYQSANEGIIIAQGEGQTIANLNWAVLVDANNQVKFQYKTSSGYTTFTNAGLKIFNDQVETFKITLDGSQLDFYKNDVFVITTNLNSAGILTSTDDLVIGGNSTGGIQLFSTTISELRLRKDLFTGTTLGNNGQYYLIEAAQENPNDQFNATNSDNWDVDTLIYLPIADNGNLKPRQLKKIPATWGDYTRWFQACADRIDATTGTINFNTTIRGYRNVQLITTDGFLYPFNAGTTITSGATEALPYWGGNDVSPFSESGGLHTQGGDVNFVGSVALAWIPNPPDYSMQAEVTGYTSLNHRFVIPSKGYIPPAERTESEGMLDTTKVDATSAKAKYNQGFRPRGIIKGTLRLGRDFILESMIQNSQDDSPVMGMPYYDVRAYDSAPRYEGGIYGAGSSSTNISSIGIYDTDFRYNEGTIHIKGIASNSIGQAEVSCRDNHNLSTGDQVFVRPGQHTRSTATNYLKEHSLSISRDYMVLTGKKYVQVVDATTVILFHDSARNNPVYIGNGGTGNFIQGFMQKTTVYGNWIQQRNRRLAHYKQPFTSMYSVTSGNNAIILDHTQRARGNEFSYSTIDLVSEPMFDGKPLLNLPSKNATLDRGDLQLNSRYFTIYDDPKGSQDDPIIINSRSGDFVSNSIGEEGAPIYIDLDSKFTGTLKIDVTNVETADSTTPTQIKYQYILNGEGATAAQPFNTGYNAWGSQAYDYNGTTHTASYGSTIEIPVTAGSGQIQDSMNRVLYSVALKVWIPDVVHASTSDNTRATYTIWFENNATATTDNVPVKLFYGGGLQPNRTILGNLNTTQDALEFNTFILRNRHYVHYLVQESNSDPDPTVEIDVKGIPLIGYSGTGETVITGSSSPNILMDAGSFGNRHYDLPYIDETITKTGGGAFLIDNKDVAPWVEQAAQTAGQYRLYRGQRYECLTSHTSSKTFEADFNQGRWALL
jgi:hypothetical protein